MITIVSGQSINSIPLDITKEAFAALGNTGEDVIVSFKSGLLDCISFRNKDSFLLDGMVIKKEDFADWLSREEALFDGDTYVLPKKRLAGFGLEDPGNGYEISLYSERIKDLYEKKLATARPVQKAAEPGNKMPLDLTVTPYTGVGALRFGASRQELVNLLGKEDNAVNRAANIIVLRYGSDMLLRLEDDRLVQVQLTNPPTLLLNNLDLTQDTNLHKLGEMYEVFERKAHLVYFEPGLAFSKTESKAAPRDYYIFDTPMKAFWGNAKRPITSM